MFLAKSIKKLIHCALKFFSRLAVMDSTLYASILVYKVIGVVVASYLDVTHYNRSPTR